MNLLISEKYITLPINTKTSSKKIVMYDDGKLVYDLDCKVDMISPEFIAYVDVSRFKGRVLDIKILPEMPLEIGVADKMDINGLYEEKYRPQIHFTVANGWNNDPNGLILHNGVYHMFYQYNPCSTEWGNMHWGHAESCDLIHWEEKDIVLYPDRMGTMYSGCAVNDKDGLAGFGSDALLLYYTACGPRCLLSECDTSSQCLAYSLDGGKSFTKYDKNPIIPTITRSNRDPKVVYVEEEKKYVMALYLDGPKYCLLSSEDLLNWNMMCEFLIEGDRECPDIYSFMCEGEKVWVISGASDFYRVGRFENGSFVFDSETKRISYSGVSYAAQSFFGTDGRVIRTSWDRIKIPENGFSQQMGVFTEMHLDKKEDEIFLCALPIKEYDNLREREFPFDGVLAKPETFDTGSGALDISISSEYTSDGGFCLNIFGEELVVDLEENTIRFKNIKMPVSLDRNGVELRIIVDRATVEIFSDNGRYTACVMNLSDDNLPRLVLKPKKASAEVSFKCFTLNSMYEK